jgi:hypothetical protein
MRYNVGLINLDQITGATKIVGVRETFYIRARVKLTEI